MEKQVESTEKEDEELEQSESKEKSVENSEIVDFKTDNEKDSDTTTLNMSKRQAAYEKKMALIAAAKKRRLAKESSETSNDNDASPSKSEKTPKKTTSSTIHRGPCVLGRIDLMNVENGNSVYAQAFLHPALRLRIVPTDEAPDHATVPTHYLNVIRRRMEQAAGRNGAVATKLKKVYSIPLKPFIQSECKGEITPGDKEYNEAYDSYYMDIVFASLGWIAISHRGKFTVKPHCVEGSVFSKRPSLYPTNIASRLDSNPDYDDPGSFSHLTEEEAMKRLRDAAKEGRHAGGGSGQNDAGYRHNSTSRSSLYGGMMGQHDDLFAYGDGPADDEWY
jgi:hypothetical protein